LSINLPRGWALAKIPDLVGPHGVFSDGDWVESEDQDPNGDVRLIQLADVGDGAYINKSNRFLTKSKARDLNCTFLKLGDVLVARMPDPLGRACIFPGDQRDSVTVVDVCVIRVEQEHIDNRWLMHFINSPAMRAEIHALQSGSTRKRISRGNLSTISLPVPPRAEQTRIVEKLEELLSDLGAGVAELKAAQRKLAQYRQSLLKAAVEGALTADWRAVHGKPQETGAELLQRILSERRARWEQKQLAKFAQKGKTPPAGWQSKYPEPLAPELAKMPALPEGWAWASVEQIIAGMETGKSFKCEERPPQPDEVGVVKVSAVSWGEYDEDESKTCVDDERINEALMVRAGDLLFSRANTIELVGACVIAKKVDRRVMLSDKILRFDLVDDRLKNWILSFLRSEAGRSQIETLASGNQDSMRNIGQERIKQIAIPIPPLMEVEVVQEVLESSLTASESQEEAISVGLKQVSAQRKNLLKAAFAGRLVPQDANDEPASKLLALILAERTSNDGSASRRRRKTT
jgi:type I restriction enzyme S subunit